MSCIFLSSQFQMLSAVLQVQEIIIVTEIISTPERK